MTFSGENLTCIRGERQVFTGLSFAVTNGEAVLLRGRNGSGKSSLLRMLAGFLSPAMGRLLWQGVAVTDDLDAHRARLAYVGHLDALKAGLTTAENLRFWARLHGADEERLHMALDRFGLAGLATDPVRYLSAGQKRRLGLARLLLRPLPLWLLDEPMLALDAASVTVLTDIIAEHRSEGGMVLAAVHGDFALPASRVLHLGAAA